MFSLDLVTPEKKLILGQELEEITLPAFLGELNILPGHAPLMTTLTPGILRYRLRSGDVGTVAISWGYCQVSLQGVSVLAEAIMDREDVDVKAAQRHLKDFEAKLAAESLDDSEWENCHLEIARLQAELELVKLPSRL